MEHEELVLQYYAAMRRGLGAEADMLALFTDDAVYSDPFGPDEEIAIGRAAIGDRLHNGWQHRPPDLEIDVLTVNVEGDRADSTWECRSTVFGDPVRGHDEYRFREGRIAELHVRLDHGDPPADSS